MDNLQLATTLVAPTGTGLLYTAYGQGEDSAVWKNGTGTSRSEISFKRIRPKPTPSHAGVTRLELKRTSYVTVADVEYPVVTTITTSIPVVADATARTNAFLHLALLARDDIFSDGVSSDVLPT